MTDSDNLRNKRAFSRQPGTISSGLLRGVKEDADEAWRRLAHLYAPLVYHWCTNAGLQHVDAEDVVQEVFRTVAAKIGMFHKNNPADSFRGWLRTITKNKVGDFYRAAEKRIKPSGGTHAKDRLQQLDDTTTTELNEESLSIENRILYYRVLEFLKGEFPDSAWQAFLRVVMDGAKPKEVADELGVTVNAVYLAKSRILRRLRSELNTCLPKSSESTFS